MAGGTELRYVLQLAYAHSQNTPPRYVNAGKDLFFSFLLKFTFPLLGECGSQDLTVAP